MVGLSTLMIMSMSIISLLFRIQFDHGINTHDGNASLNSTLELLELTHARLQYTGLEAVMDTALGQVETVVAVFLLLGDGLFLFVGFTFLDTLGDGVALAELGNEFGGVFGGVHGEGLGDDEEGLGEFADG
jgi:hypothetical protein